MNETETYKMQREETETERKNVEMKSGEESESLKLVARFKFLG